MSRPARAAFVLVAVLLGALALSALPVGDALAGLATSFQGLGAWGGVAFGLVYAVATVALLPVSALSLAAGAVYGTGWGVLVVWPGATLGALGAFGLGRTWLRARADQALAASPRLQALDAAVAEDGFVLVLLLRLSPAVPFNLLNLGLGATRIPIGTYALATAIGILPGTVLYVMAGASVQAVTGADPGGRTMFWVGLVATVLATAWITRIARRALAARLPEDPTPPEAP